jgi:hypothetical protein
MVKRFLILFLILGLFAIAEKTHAQYLYKWVDEKGVFHISDTPPPQASSKEERRIQGENTKASMKSLKGLELGSRAIPEDMKKYGPGGGGEATRRTSDQPTSSTTSTPVRRS